MNNQITEERALIKSGKEDDMALTIAKWATAIVIVTFTVYLATLELSYEHGISSLWPEEFANVLAGWFSPIGLLWVAVAVLLQQRALTYQVKELTRSTAALEEQSKQLTKQTEHFQDSFRYQKISGELTILSGLAGEIRECLKSIKILASQSQTEVDQIFKKYAFDEKINRQDHTSIFDAYIRSIGELIELSEKRDSMYDGTGKGEVWRSLVTLLQYIIGKSKYISSTLPAGSEYDSIQILTDDVRQVSSKLLEQALLLTPD